MSTDNGVKVALIAGGASVLVSLITAGFALVQANNNSDKITQIKSEGAQEVESQPVVAPPVGQPAEKGQKVCSAFTDGAYRDSILVPDYWKPADCQQFANQLGLNYGQMACIFPTGMVWGEARTPAPPARDCGWAG